MIKTVTLGDQIISWLAFYKLQGLEAYLGSSQTSMMGF